MKKGIDRLDYDPLIDVIRAFAFFLVFFTHFVNRGGNGVESNLGQWWNHDVIQRVANFGGQGVTIFFSLTGFLLGRLLIRELSTTGNISISSFMIRRILRIWPLYILFLLVCALLNTLSKSPTITLKELPYLLSFTYNWGQIYGGLPGTIATITWSISVEEQIYLVFPGILLAFRKVGIKYASYFLITFGFGLQILISRFFTLPIDRSTLAYFGVVGIGLLSAIYEKKIRTEKKFRVSILPIFLILYIYYIQDLRASFIGQFLIFVLSAILVPLSLFFLSQIDLRFDTKWLKPIAFVGRRSYGCYLWHWMIWTIMVGKGIFFNPIGGFSVLGVTVALISTITIATFSYKYFERYFLTIRKRYRRVESP
jgi:peptidoglycan/LPS O-acetylase OafA/YrhL